MSFKAKGVTALLLDVQLHHLVYSLKFNMNSENRLSLRMSGAKGIEYEYVPSLRVLSVQW